MRSKLYKERVEICLTPEQKELLSTLAIKQSKTMNEIIREAILNYGRFLYEKSVKQQRR